MPSGRETVRKRKAAARCSAAAGASTCRSVTGVVATWRERSIDARRARTAARTSRTAATPARIFFMSAPGGSADSEPWLTEQRQSSMAAAPRVGERGCLSLLLPLSQAPHSLAIKQHHLDPAVQALLGLVVVVANQPGSRIGGVGPVALHRHVLAKGAGGHDRARGIDAVGLECLVDGHRPVGCKLQIRPEDPGRPPIGVSLDVD